MIRSDDGITAILTVHNQEDIIYSVLHAVHENSSGLVAKLIILLDGCTDGSSDIVTNYYGRIPTEIYELPNVFETKANNFGLLKVKTPLAVIIQDDCLIKEWGYDLMLTTPMIRYDNVFAVSGRNAHDIRPSGDVVDYYNIAGWGTDRADNRKFYLRAVVNRGPLMLRMDVVDKLNYFDEAFYPQNSDDHDLCLRAYREGWLCGCMPIQFSSEYHWGGTRKGNGKWIADAIEKNQKLIRERHWDLITKDYPDEDRCLP